MYLLYSITSPLKNTEHIPIFVNIYLNCTITDKSNFNEFISCSYSCVCITYYEYYDMIKQTFKNQYAVLQLVFIIVKTCRTILLLDKFFRSFNF